MIFKTFDSDIDKWTAKIGVFGKSFNELGTAINNAFEASINNIDNFDENIGFLETLKNNLAPKNKNGDSWLRNSLGEIISTENINSYIAELDLTSAKNKLTDIFDWNELVKNGDRTWDEYFDTLKGGNEYIIDTIKNTDDLSKLTGDDLVKANQNARQSALAHNESLKQQTLGAKAASVAMNLLSTAANMLVMYAISKLITAWDDYKEKLHEVANENAEQAEKSAEYVENLLDLQNQLKEGTKNSDELTKAFKEQLRVMGYTEDKIDDLIVKYGDLSGAISETTRKALEDAKTDAYTDLASASKALEIDSLGGLTTDILITDFGTGIDELDKQINEILSEVATKTAEQGQAWIAKDDSAEGLYAYYNALQKVSRLIQETASETNNQDLLNLGNVFDTTTYGEITEAIDKLKESAGLYGDAISRLHNADAQLELSNYLKTNNINSKEAFDSYVDGIKNNTTYSEEYKQVLLEVANDAFPQFSAAAKDVSDSLSDFPDKITDSLSISETVTELNTKLKPALDSLSSAYKDIFTSDGFTKGNIGVDMLSSVKESIAELNEIDGVNIDSSSFEEFARVLSDTSSTSQDIQDQFNSLASTIVYATSSTEISTENFEVLTKALEEMGLVDARKVLTDIKTAQDEIIAQGYDLTNMTAEQAEQFINEGEVALKTVEYLRMYMIQKELSNNSLSTSNDVSNLEKLCNSLGVTGDLLTWVIKLKSALGAVENGAPIEAFRSQIDEAREKIAELSTSNYGQFQFDFTGNSDTSKSEKDYADLLEKETTLLEKQLEAGLITFKDYTDKRKSIIENYYRQGLISAEDYYSALEDMYDYQLSLYDKVIDAVNYRIDKEIDALEKEKESIEDTYNLKIELIQTEIDELEKAREKRQQQVDLEKALYEVEKARSQRNVKLYSGSDRGFIYTNDGETLREAEENLENEKYESHISKLEEQIESLEKEMEKATDTIDEQINALSDYADKWSDVADEYEHAQNDMLTSQILGANYEEEILNQRMATLEIFKNNYIAAQNAMAEANRKVYESQVSNTSNNVSNPSGSKPPVEPTPPPKVVKEKVSPSWTDAQGGKGYATSQIANYNGNGVEQGSDGKWYVYKLKKYHTGLDEGYVGDKTPLSKDKRLDVLQKVGNGDLLKSDEQLSILKNDELVLTKHQGINIADTLWQKAMIPSINLPNYNLDSKVLRNNSNNVVMNVSLNCPNVTNESGFKYIERELSLLPTRALQYNWKD